MKNHHDYNECCLCFVGDLRKRNITEIHSEYSFDLDFSFTHEHKFNLSTLFWKRWIPSSLSHRKIKENGIQIPFFVCVILTTGFLPNHSFIILFKFNGKSKIQ